MLFSDTEKIDEIKTLTLYKLIECYRKEKDLLVHVYVPTLKLQKHLMSWFGVKSNIGSKLRIFKDTLKASGWEHADVSILYESHKMEFANEWRMDGIVTLEIE